MRRLRELWNGGRPTVGAWCAIADTFTAELMGHAGFDWICVDLQHGFVRGPSLVPILQALDSTGTPAFVRVQWNIPSEIMRALDAGAQGVIVPLVNTEAEALDAVSSCRYPPTGLRSWGPTRAALLQSVFDTENANEDVVCAVMIETPEAVQNVEAIANVPGVDALFVGPNDLSLSSGSAPSYRADTLDQQEMLKSVLEAAELHGVIPGISCGTADMARQRSEEGFRMLAVGADWNLLRTAAANVVAEARSYGLGR